MYRVRFILVTIIILAAQLSGYANIGKSSLFYTNFQNLTSQLNSSIENSHEQDVHLYLGSNDTFYDEFSEIEEEEEEKNEFEVEDKNFHNSGSPIVAFYHNLDYLVQITSIRKDFIFYSTTPRLILYQVYRI